MSAREAALAEELGRQQALRWVSDQLVEATEEQLGCAVEHIARLVTALENIGAFDIHGDKVVVHIGELESVTADEALEIADAIRGARVFLAEMDDDENDDDGPVMCPCGEPATVTLAGGEGDLCAECAGVS